MMVLLRLLAFLCAEKAEFGGGKKKATGGYCLASLTTEHQKGFKTLD